MNRIAKELIKIARIIIKDKKVAFKSTRLTKIKVIESLQKSVNPFKECREKIQEGLNSLQKGAKNVRSIQENLGLGIRHQIGKDTVNTLHHIMKAVDACEDLEKKYRLFLFDAKSDAESSKPLAASSKTAGHERLTIRGSGWDVGDALRNALDSVRDEYGYNYEFREVLKTKRIKAPKPAKKVKIQKETVRKGPVKRFFEIEQRSRDRNGKLQSDKRYYKQYDKQGDVLKAAKALALEYSTSLVINLVAHCVGNTRLATVTPEQGQLGVWQFVADFHR